MMKSSLFDGSEEEDTEEDLGQHQATVTTWASTAANRRPPRRTFASRNQRGRPNAARKALNIGATPGRGEDSASIALRQGQRISSEDENIPNFSLSSSTSSTKSLSRSHHRSFSVQSVASSASSSQFHQRHNNNSHVDMSALSPVPALPPRGGCKKEPLQTRGKSIPPLPPSRIHRMTRSFSLGLGSPPPHRDTLRDALREVHGLDESPPPPWMRENSNPNLEEELLEGDEESSTRGRKKLRARRASIQGTIPSLSEMSSSFLKRQITLPLESSFPPPIPPATRSFSTSDYSPSKCRSLSESYAGYGGSPSNSSRASSRKRGVCGSPVSDFMDDASIGGLSASINSNGSFPVRRSRSRILSPPLNVHPLPPSLGPPLILEAQRSNKKPLGPDECRRMGEYQSDADLDDDQSQDSFQDTSFAASTEDHHAVPVITVPTERSHSGSPDGKENTKEQDIFETMSSYDDLKFLIKALRKEASGKSSAFGGNLSWTVALPAAWPSARRSAFFRWTVLHFQFTVRPLGNSVNVLQVSKTKGQVVLSKLETALISYKETAVAAAEKRQEIKNNAMVLQSPFGVNIPLLHSPPASCSKPNGISANKMFHCATTEELASDLLALSMDEEKPRQSGVLLEFGGDFVEIVAGSQSSEECIEVVAAPCTFIEESIEVSVKSPLPSFEHSVAAPSGILCHIHGHDSPDLSNSVGRTYVRRPKLSFESVASPYPYMREDDPKDGRQPKLSFGSTGSGYGSLGRPSAPTPIQTLEVFETPQIKQDEGWGSRPIEGKDWGASRRCEEELLGKLSERVEAAIRSAGVRDSMESFDGLPVMPCGLDLDDFTEHGEDLEGDVIMHEGKNGKTLRRLHLSFAKHQRVSLWAAASQDGAPLLPGRTSVFPARPKSSFSQVEEAPKPLHAYVDSFPLRESSVIHETTCPLLDPLPEEQVGTNEMILQLILSFLTESDLLCKVSLVSTTWARAASSAHAALLMASVGYVEDSSSSNDGDDEQACELATAERPSVSVAMDRDWKYLTSMFPWACFLSCGAFKRVFKVYNSKVMAEEAISVMDVDAITDKKTIAAELVVTAMLSTLSRRGICPNFIVMHGVFTLPYDVPESHWGSEDKKKPNGAKYLPKKKYSRPRQPKDKFPGRYQVIRMELCNQGDCEEFLKRKTNECLPKEVARASLFQIAFAMHAAAERHSLKHYDIKLLNVFVQDINPTTPHVVLRYGLGSHIFALRLPKEHAFYAKLADYGTANIQAESTGQPVTIAQFTTLENTPPDYLILGDEATQGHGHDNFGLGLSMLHLFTGHAPYEEILEEVVCPVNLKKKLRMIWEDEMMPQYSVIRSIILSDVYKDERGHIMEGEPDETLYDTLYRFLVLFGIPDETFELRKCPAVWKAIYDALVPKNTASGARGTDFVRYENDCQKYSIRRGNNRYIARARQSLQAMEGGMELLFQLCSFNPNNRATSLQVLNSDFMKGLREKQNSNYGEQDTVLSFTAFSTHR